MIYYYSIFIIFFLIAIFENNFPNKIKLTLIPLSFIFFVFLAGFRSNSFGDYCTYEYFYIDSPDLFQYLYNPFIYKRHTDFGFQLIIGLSKIFTSSSLLLMIITAIISVTIYFYCFRKMSPFFFISILIYFSHTFILKDLAQIRAGLASSLILLTIYFFANRKLKSGFVIFISSTLMHLSAFPAILVFLSNKLNFSKIIWFLLLSFSLLLALLQFDLLLFSILETLNILPNRFYVYYHSATITVNNYDLGIFTNPATVKYIIISIFAILYYDELNKISKYFKPAFILYIFGTAWIIVFNDFSIFAARIASILTIGELILLPMFILLVKQENIAKLIICILLAVIFFYNLNYRGTEESDFQVVPANPLIFMNDPCDDTNMKEQWQNQELLSR